MPQRNPPEGAARPARCLLAPVQPNSGPVNAQTKITSTASVKASGLPIRLLLAFS